MTLVSGKIKLPFIWKRVCLIIDFLLVQTMICNHLYTFNKIFQKHVLGGQYEAEPLHGHRGLFLTTSHPPVFVRSRSSHGSHIGSRPQHKSQVTLPRHSVTESVLVSAPGGSAPRKLAGPPAGCTTGGPVFLNFPKQLLQFLATLLSVSTVRVSWVHYLLPPFLIS